MNKHVSFLQAKNWVVVIFLGLSIPGFFIVQQVTHYQLDQVREDAWAVTYLFSALYASLGIFCYVLVMMTFSFAGYGISKYWLKKQELATGFQLTNTICAVVLVGVTLCLSVILTGVCRL